MTVITHTAFTLPFTGFFASLLFGIDLLASPWHLIAALTGSTLPDISRPETLLGRLCRPLAAGLQRLSAAGAPTHNLAALTAATLSWAVAERLLSDNLTTATLFCLAYFGHLVLDMCAREGAPLLYPFNPSLFVLIGNPALRLRPEDVRHEVAVILLCATAAFLLQPFFSRGLRTTFNQSFATIEHLHDEFQRSPCALRVHYRYRQGSTKKEGSGFCIESTYDRATLLLDNGRWLRLDEKEMVILKVVPERSGRKFFIKSMGFSAVRPDSLTRLLENKRILSLTVAGNHPFLVNNGAESNRTELFREEYLNSSPSFTAIPPLPDSSVSRNRYLPQINALLREQRFIRDHYNGRLRQYQLTRDSLEMLRSRYRQTDDLPTRERLFETIHELEKEIPPDPEEEKIAAINIRLLRLQEEVALKAPPPSIPRETLLKGRVKWAVIEYQ